MNFYNIKNINKEIIYPDIYFTPEYGKACEYSDNAIWELCQYKDLIYVYLKREYIFEGEIYYDLITPYGYSGYYFENQQTYNEFIKIFREEAKKKNYLTEVVRQNPYLNINISEHYEVITSKQIFSVEIDNYYNYFKNNLSSKTRNIVNKANKLNIKYNITNLDIDIINKYFKELYNINMDKVHASEYYYFNNNYYEQLTNIKYTKLIIILDEDNHLIGSSILFEFEKFIHYHLSCNDNSSNCITNYLLNSVIKELGLNKKIILGGGLKDNDTLYNFKKKISTNSYEYTIYKNILNHEVYDKIKKQYEVVTYFPIHRK